MLRIELMANEPITNWRRIDTYGRSHVKITQWIEYLEGYFGKIFAGWAFKFGPCVPSRGSNVTCHIALIVDEFTDRENNFFVLMANKFWQEITQGRGKIINCDTTANDWCFRASRQHDTILTQLNAAAIYMAATDDLVRFHVKDGPPTFAMGKIRPKTQEAASARQVPTSPLRPKMMIKMTKSLIYTRPRKQPAPPVESEITEPIINVPDIES
ncbi:MAG: hypothetical protein EKK47_13885 [Burkholderiales bacterium]|nr:MAG: hypothetical protein EKK47_13885 [Burkholderiales bacterium]